MNKEGNKGHKDGHNEIKKKQHPNESTPVKTTGTEGTGNKNIIPTQLAGGGGLLIGTV